MKKSILTSFILLVAAVFTMVNAQTLDEVLAKHFKAVGQEKLSDVKTFQVKAKISQMGMELPMTMILKQPGKFRLEMDMQGQTMVQAFDGDKGWMIAPWLSPDPQELAGDQLKQAASQADMEGELYNYEKKGHMVDFIGKVKDGDKDVYRIKLTTEDGDVRNYFIDAETYLVAKVKAKVEAMGQTADVEQRMSDYKTINGITMAMKIESDSPMGTAVITMESVEFNVDIDDAVFARPAK
jgi:outer membrane lipoprotein-sorting protein